MAAFDGAVLHRIDDLERRNNFAASKNLDLEFIIGRFRDGLGHHFGPAIQRVERLRPTAVIRHLSSGIDWAIAGAATALAATPSPAAFKN